jgi:hypothetical protein
MQGCAVVTHRSRPRERIQNTLQERRPPPDVGKLIAHRIKSAQHTFQGAHLNDVPALLKRLQRGALLFRGHRLDETGHGVALALAGAGQTGRRSQDGNLAGKQVAKKQLDLLRGRRGQSQLCRSSGASLQTTSTGERCWRRAGEACRPEVESQRRCPQRVGTLLTLATDTQRRDKAPGIQTCRALATGASGSRRESNVGGGQGVNLLGMVWCGVHT